MTPQLAQSTRRMRALCLGLAALAVAGIGVTHALPSSLAWPSSHTSMLTMHLLLELFAIVIATLVATVSWHTFDAQGTYSPNLLLAGFLTVATCDLVHALAYEGMPPFLGPSSTPRAIFFWLMGRSVEVVTLGLVAWGWTPRFSRGASLALGVGLSAALVWVGSYHLDAFPSTFAVGQGVTRFKAGYEYGLFGLNMAVALMLWRQAPKYKRTRYYLLAMSCFLIGVGELMFTDYRAPSDFQNIFGHVYKLAAYALLYWATFYSSIRAPFEAVRESERQTRESEMRLRSLSNNLPNCVVYQVVREADGSMHFVHVSDSVERLTGVKAQDVLRDPNLLYAQLNPDDLPLLLAAEEQSARTLHVFDFVARWGREPGPVRWMHFFSAPRQLEDGRIAWDGVQMDITAQRADEEARLLLESRLRESQKMQAIGTLAGGIAHDFNNVLGSILGNLALAQEEVKGGATERALQSLEQVNKASLRARELVQQILTFSRGQPQALVPQPLRPLVEESLGLLRATLPALVTLDTRLADAPVQVMADATQIEQVVMNLCTNAWQAMKGRTGRICVGLERVALSASAGSDMGLPAGDYAHLWVSDEGVGIDSALQQRIFEPFYTTKSAGEGTGLGLAVVHGIVSSHHGGLRVESIAGHGSTFHVYLPCLSVPITVVSRTIPSASHRPGQGQHVLYIDDDELMALMVERLLERDGYRVSSYRSPLAALAAVRAQPAAFDIVVTDFNMPDRSGLEVAQELAYIRPGLPVVISSGYLTDELQLDAHKHGVRALMQKQNTLEELGALIQRVLNEPVPHSTMAP